MVTRNYTVSVFDAESRWLEEQKAKGNKNNSPTRLLRRAIKEAMDDDAGKAASKRELETALVKKDRLIKAFSQFIDDKKLLDAFNAH